MSDLSQHELSVLVILAENESLTIEDKRRLMQHLDGLALEIAKALTGEPTIPPIQSMANGLTFWARGLRPDENED